MSRATDQNLLLRLEEAKFILDSRYKKFQEFIEKYKVKYDTPLWDIVCFLILIDLPEKSIIRQKWVEFWHKFGKTRKFKNLVYIVPASYIQLADIEKAKKFFLELLEQNTKLSKELDWNVFLSVFFQFRSSIRPTFAKRDFSVFLKILEQQSMITKELSEILNLDSSNVSKYKNNLISRRVFHQGISLNFHRLNLNIYGMLFEYPLSVKIDLFKELSHSSFFHSLYKSEIGCNSALVYYVTPNYEGIKGDLEKLVSKLSKKKNIPNTEVFQFLTSTRLKSFNYTSYDCKEGKWNLTSPVIQLKLNGYDPLKEKQIPIITRDFEIISKKKLILNKIGIDILNHILTKNHLSIREIQNDLNLTEKEAKKQIQNLKKQDLYKLRYNPSYIFGLKNLVLFIRNSNTTQLDLHKNLSFFPEVYSEQYETSEKKGLYFVIRIPNELIVESTEILFEYFKEDIEKMFTIDQMFRKRYQLPEEKYETVFQEWKYNSEDILGS